MTPDEARRVLGVPAGTPLTAVVERYRELQRRHHPDVVGSDDPSATAMSARLNLALEVLRAQAATDPDDGSAGEVATGATARGATPPPVGDDRPAHGARSSGPDEDEPPEVVLDGDSLFVGAPPDETFLRLLDAGVGLGGIGHVDPRLGLLELVVRFEGGPTCSVLLTLQGRSHGTEVFCEMESIEAAPTPPVGPVLLALVEELRRSAAHPRPGVRD